MRSLPLKLAPGSDLRLSLEQLASEQHVSGFVIGVVGNLSRAAFQCPGHHEPTVLNGDLEVITLNGTLSPQGVHLHLSLSDGACQVWGGHLEPGTVVQKGVDVLLGITDRNEASETDDDAPNPSALQTEPRLEIAILPGCPWCARALRLLRTLDIHHRVETINGDDDFQRWQARSGMTTFPQVFIDGELVGGYDDLTSLHTSGGLETLR